MFYKEILHFFWGPPVVNPIAVNKYISMNVKNTITL